MFRGWQFPCPFLRVLTHASESIPLSAHGLDIEECRLGTHRGSNADIETPHPGIRRSVEGSTAPRIRRRLANRCVGRPGVFRVLGAFLGDFTAGLGLKLTRLGGHTPILSGRLRGRQGGAANDARLREGRFRRPLLAYINGDLAPVAYWRPSGPVANSYLGPPWAYCPAAATWACS